MMQARKTIAIDIRLLGKKRTGDEMVFFHLTREIIRLDQDHRYVLLTDETDPIKVAALAARLGCAGERRVHIVSLPAQNRFTWNLWVLPRYLFQNRVDVLHTQYILPLMIPRRTRIALHIHDVSFRAYPELIRFSDRLFLFLLIPRALRQAAVIITPSQFTKEEIGRYYRVRLEKIHVIPNALGEEFFTQAPLIPKEIARLRRTYRLPEKFWLYVGTLQPRKNLPFLIRVFTSVHQRLRTALPQGSEIGLVIAGNRHALHVDPALDPFLAENTEHGALVFPGFIPAEDLPGVMRLASLFVYPSLYEGFGIPLLEAMSQGVPVASSDIPSLREVAGPAATYFDPHSVAKTAETLYTLCIDQKRRQLTVRYGRDRLLLYSWRKSAELLRALYHTL